MIEHHLNGDIDSFWLISIVFFFHKVPTCQVLVTTTTSRLHSASTMVLIWVGMMILLWRKFRTAMANVQANESSASEWWKASGSRKVTICRYVSSESMQLEIMLFHWTLRFKAVYAGGWSEPQSVLVTVSSKKSWLGEPHAVLVTVSSKKSGLSELQDRRGCAGGSSCHCIPALRTLHALKRLDLV